MRRLGARLPRIAPVTRLMVLAIGLVLYSEIVGTIVVVLQGATPRLAGTAGVLIVFVPVLLAHLVVLHRAGPRTDASVRLQFLDGGGALARSAGQMWRDFPLFVALRIAVGMLSVIFVVAVVFIAVTGRSFISSTFVGLVVALLGLAIALLFAWLRYRRLRFVDFATSPCSVLHIVAALLLDADGRALLVRKRGTTKFMQPGGKPEAGESDAEALSRELQEELGLVIPPTQLTFVGQYWVAAANESDTILDARVFDAPIVTAPVRVAAEIEELIWIDPAAPGYLDLAPLSSEELLPLLAARGASSPS